MVECGKQGRLPGLVEPRLPAFDRVLDLLEAHLPRKIDQARTGQPAECEEEMTGLVSPNRKLFKRSGKQGHKPVQHRFDSGGGPPQARGCELLDQSQKSQACRFPQRAQLVVPKRAGELDWLITGALV